MLSFGVITIFLLLILPSLSLSEHWYINTKFSGHKGKTVYLSTNTIIETICESSTGCASVCGRDERCCLVNFIKHTTICTLYSSCFMELVDMTEGIVMIKENFKGKIIY